MLVVSSGSSNIQGRCLIFFFNNKKSNKVFLPRCLLHFQTAPSTNSIASIEAKLLLFFHASTTGFESQPRADKLHLVCGSAASVSSRIAAKRNSVGPCRAQHVVHGVQQTSKCWILITFFFKRMRQIVFSLFSLLSPTHPEKVA